MFSKDRIGEILQQLALLRYPHQIPLTDWRMQHRPGESRPTPQDRSGAWETIPAAGIWGGHCEYYAFTRTVTIPEDFAGQPVDFTLRTGKEGEWDATNPQFSLYVDGVLRQGFDTNHRQLRLTDCARAGETFEIFLSAYTGVQNFHLLFDAGLRTVDESLNKLYYDILVPWETMCLLEREESAYRELDAILTGTVNLLDLRKPGSDAYHRSIREATEYIVRQLYTDPRPAEAIIRCVGHTHIDVAWLWTLSVTEDKSVRSFSTVLELMRRYPEYIFMSSQPQLYKYVKKNAPGIYEQIRQRVEEGRWETEGGMFVEADCNLASGEALVRQFLYGKRFFRQEFGKDNKILWLPDVFGYSAALPQIMKKCGIRYFMTTKISWNEYNKMPYDSFYWKGIDGTKILTHFIPSCDYKSGSHGVVSYSAHSDGFTTYNAYLTPRQMKGAWQRYQQKALNGEVLSSFGYGDGGGGPDIEMLEAQRRLSYGIPGCPATKPSTALDFFRKLESDLDGKKVPVWSGELYLEYHRGTYTSMARNKKFNRRSEFALANLETAGVLAQSLCGAAYPAETLSENWERLLRNQFHDILPGSSIKEVYEDSKAEYEALFSSAGSGEAALLQAVADGVGGTVVFNPNGQTLSGFVTLPDAAGLRHVQQTADGQYLAWAENIPAKGYARLQDIAPAGGDVTVSPACIETPYARILLNGCGQITSWFDKTARREVLQAGQKANVLMTYEDKPHQFDNWNIYEYYTQKSWPVENLLSAEVTEHGPYRWALQLKWLYQDSPITETVYVYAGSPRVDFRFESDWQEDQILLKALFPVELNTNEATFEIQYGNVKRPTTTNTSWDRARFEVCHHKWLDLSEGDYGVSLLNDCKFGVSVSENVVGLSLLKCGRYPNPEADREHHEAVYSFYPHAGSWQEAGTVAQAYLLNNPLRAVTARSGEASLPEALSLVSHDHRNIMVEAVKKAEDSDATVIRFYEFENRRTDTALRLSGKAKKIWLCNMLEEKEQLLAEDTDCVTVPTEPFGIMTILVENN